MAFICALLWLLSFTGFLVLCTGKSFEDVVTISILSGSILLYLGGFLNHLSYGFYLSLLLILVFYVQLVYLFINKKEKFLDFTHQYFSLGTVVFILLTVYAYFLTGTRGFVHCDEFAHWGPMARESFQNDAFYTISNATFRHKDYPPLFTLIEVLFCFFRGSFSETSCYFAVMVFTFSMTIPLYRNLKMNRIQDVVKVIIFFICSLLVGSTIPITDTMSDSALVYNSIYIDWPLAMFTAYCLYLVYRLEKWDDFELVRLSICGVSFLLMKQMGFFFYGVVVIYSLARLFLIDKNFSWKLIGKGVVALAVIPLVFWITWKTYISTHQVGGQFSVSQIEVFKLVDILKGRMGEEWQREAFRNYRYAIFNRPLETHPYELTYCAVISLISVLLLLLGKSRKNSSLLACDYLLFGMAYAGIMGVLYIFSFGSEEGPQLASFNRYMQTYLYLGKCLLVMKTAGDMEKMKLPVYLLALILLYFNLETETIKEIKINNSTECDINKYPMLVFKKEDSVYKFEREDLRSLQIDFVFVDANDYSAEELKEMISNYSSFLICDQSQSLKEAWPSLSEEERSSSALYEKAGNNMYHRVYFSYSYFLLNFYMDCRLNVFE